MDVLKRKVQLRFSICNFGRLKFYRMNFVIRVDFKERNPAIHSASSFIRAYITDFLGKENFMKATSVLAK